MVRMAIEIVRFPIVHGHFPWLCEFTRGYHSFSYPKYDPLIFEKTLLTTIKTLLTIIQQRCIQLSMGISVGPRIWRGTACEPALREAHWIFSWLFLWDRDLWGDHGDIIGIIWINIMMG